MSAESPTISIVTPSFNQAAFLRQTIESVLSQGYEALEYVIIDGGSTDHSVDIIQEYAADLKYWVSEPDGGMYDALNKGFSHTTGELMAWINSDDMYLPWSFKVVADAFTRFGEVRWLSTLAPFFWDERGIPTQVGYLYGFSRKGFMAGENLMGGGWHAPSFIQQESTFWRRDLWEQAGSRLESNLSLAGDYELWARFYRYADLYGIRVPLGGFRVQPQQQTALRFDDYVAEAVEVLQSMGGAPAGRTRSLVRRWLAPALGRMPSTVRRSAARLGLIYSSPQILFDWSTRSVSIHSDKYV